MKLTKRALQQRINRVLKRKRRILRKPRIGTPMYNSYGEFYMESLDTGEVTRRNINIVKLGRDMNQLHAYEQTV